jgi:hypothetical protein
MKNLTILLLLVATITVNAADIVVNGSGLAGTYTTISAAVQAANEGDKILVSNQAFPYQEDTLFIDKSVSIIPYNDIAYINFEGHIKITLDSIAELTLIGFDCNGTNIFSVFNDTSRNSLSTVNIVDCKFSNINLSQPKTSLYLSYSTVPNVRFSHGDIIGNSITSVLSLGIHDYSNYGTNAGSYQNAIQNNYENKLGYQYNFSVCDLYNNNVRFGNVDTYSDTCNIIANDLGKIVINTLDFAYNIRNNSGPDNSQPIMVYLSCPTATGINQIINNSFFESSSNSNNYAVHYCLAYCSSSTPSFNFSDVTLHMYNNSCYYPLQIDAPYNQNSNSVYSLSTLSNIVVSKGASAYNKQSYIASDVSYLDTIMFDVGPSNNSGTTPNPSAEFLNLDLTLNTRGSSGGSDAWDNYHPNGSCGFGTMTGSKARITYLNLPTQIFDPSNIKIKAKAVHGN